MELGAGCRWLMSCMRLLALFTAQVRYVHFPFVLRRRS